MDPKVSCISLKTLDTLFFVIRVIFAYTFPINNTSWSCASNSVLKEWKGLRAMTALWNTQELWKVSFIAQTTK